MGCRDDIDCDEICNSFIKLTLFVLNFIIIVRPYAAWCKIYLDSLCPLSLSLSLSADLHVGKRWRYSGYRYIRSGRGGCSDGHRGGGYPRYPWNHTYNHRSCAVSYWTVWLHRSSEGTSYLTDYCERLIARKYKFNVSFFLLLFYSYYFYFIY